MPMHHITSNVPATENQQNRTKVATTADPALNQLRHYIFHGWLLQRQQLPEQLQHYWNYHEELAVGDGLMFKAHWLVIPTSLRAEGLHAGHLGGEKTLLRAWETVFWPRISDDVRNAVKLCDVYMKPAQQKEQQVPHDVPSLPWFKLGVEMFEYHSHYHLLVANYFSKFPFVKKLTDQMAGPRINMGYQQRCTQIWEPSLCPKNSNLPCSTDLKCNTLTWGILSRMVSLRLWSELWRA